ncbi:MAG: formylmethanofuran dehydrogenase [Chloroflexi bacterium]|nr:formylmethanofuran dehydrogenase [Chloroflexota bacterium]
MKPLDALLRDSATHHHRLCPRQVLGARVGMLAASLLDLNLPQSDKRLLAIAETDGCFVDGISAATGCYVGRRTLRIEDYGKTAATFVDTLTEQAIRIAPRAGIRELAWDYAPSARNKWEAQLIGYQHIPDDLLLDWQWVKLAVPVKKMIGQAGRRVVCERCGEEIINQKEVMCKGNILCKTCAGESYFRFADHTMEMATA